MDEPTVQSFATIKWANETNIHPVGLLAIIFLGIAMLGLPRRYATVPMILMACFIAPAQRVVIGGLDFSLLRIIVIFGWLRLIAFGELKGFTWKPIDKLMILLMLSECVIGTILWRSGSMLITRLGSSFESLGLYFAFRCWVRDWDDVKTFISCFALVSIPMVLAFAIEHHTRRNLFAFLGGVPAVTMIRQGKLRCQGAFSHPIMAGCFWCALIPFFLAGWKTKAIGALTGFIGTVNSIAIVMLSNSSTPMFGAMMAFFGMWMIRFRHKMHTVRWGLVFTLFCLHMCMQSPVWSLLARIDLAGGSTGWQRYFLIDMAIKHINQWWLIGIRDPGQWHPSLRDVTNQYLLEGVTGGMITMALFIAVISVAFRGVGRLWRTMGTDKNSVILSWSLGAALFVHVMNFMAVSYFGQIVVVWYLLLATIGSFETGPLPKPVRIETKLEPQPA